MDWLVVRSCRSKNGEAVRVGDCGRTSLAGGIAPGVFLEMDWQGSLTLRGSCRSKEGKVVRGEAGKASSAGRIASDL